MKFLRRVGERRSRDLMRSGTLSGADGKRDAVLTMDQERNLNKL